jgi:TPR repeat protein
MTTRHTFARAAALAALLAALHAAPAAAGPAEDYAEGAKRYAAGDVVAAMPLLRKAADAGHAAAQAAIAHLLEQADWADEALGYYRKAAAQGDADGQFGLGAMLSVGRGVQKNEAEARKWILLAAEQGHKLAINELAAAYIGGGLDIPEAARQGPEALRWIRAAADNNDLAAMEKLAAAYRTGAFGIAADARTAAQWDEKIRKARGIRQGRRNKKEQ